VPYALGLELHDNDRPDGCRPSRTGPSIVHVRARVPVHAAKK